MKEETIIEYKRRKHVKDLEHKKWLEKRKRVEDRMTAEFKEACQENRFEYKWSNGYIFEATKNGYIARIVNQESRMFLDCHLIPETDGEYEMLRDAKCGLEDSDPSLAIRIKEEMKFSSTELNGGSLSYAIKRANKIIQDK